MVDLNDDVLDWASKFTGVPINQTSSGSSGAAPSSPTNTPTQSDAATQSDLPAPSTVSATAGVSSLSDPSGQSTGVGSGSDSNSGAPPASPDPRLVSLYSQLGINATPQQLSGFDACFSPKLALVGAVAGVLGSGAATIALVLAPDPTTLTKWAAAGSALALIAALIGLAAAFGALADCESGAEDAAEKQREINQLRDQQKAILKTVDDLKKEMDKIKQ